MKKGLLCLAGLAAVGAASAQSTVTVFGVLDVAVSGYKNQSETPTGVTVNTTKTQMSTGGLTAGRLGFRGTEDLGGGLAANFWLEGSLSPDTGNGAGAGGAFMFNRRATVGLSGAFGEFRLGRDVVPTYWNDAVFDPFGNLGVGASLVYTANGGVAFGVPNSGFEKNMNYVRASNSIAYFLPPNLGGFYGQVMYAFDEKTSYDPGGLTPPGVPAVVANPALVLVPDNARAGGYYGGRFGYARGALDVAVGLAKSTVASNFYAGSTTALSIVNVGASYDFDVVKVFGEYSNNKQKTDLAINKLNPFGLTKPGANGVVLGVTVPIGPGLIRAAYSAVRYTNVNLNITGLNPNPKADQVALGYVYNLSKRTALYASAVYIENKNGASLSVSSVGAPTFYTGRVPGSPGSAVPDKSMGYDFGIRHVF
ncbi:porin [Variovorax sp. M-6]|uniref:porin n=1 Tax=Variovorax sp. M-6 TaxID=3233041 RepID=UPI003F9B77CD